MAKQHNFDRHQSREDWDRAGVLEKAYEQAKNIQSLKQNQENDNPS